MKRIILSVLIIIVLAAGVYYGSFLVRDTEVNEAAPLLMDNKEVVADERGSNPTVSSLRGEFGVVDAVHKGSGKAILIRQGDTRILRFENFEVVNGPDLYVYLIKNDAPTHDNASLGEYLSLGRLKGNVGDQNYEFKTTDFPNKNLDEYDTAVIWCRQFGTLFTYANLK